MDDLKEDSSEHTVGAQSMVIAIIVTLPSIVYSWP